MPTTRTRCGGEKTQSTGKPNAAQLLKRNGAHWTGRGCKAREKISSSVKRRTSAQKKGDPFKSVLGKFVKKKNNEKIDAQGIVQ